MNEMGIAGASLLFSSSYLPAYCTATPETEPWLSVLHLLHCPIFTASWAAVGRSSSSSTYYSSLLAYNATIKVALMEVRKSHSSSSLLGTVALVAKGALGAFPI